MFRIGQKVVCVDDRNEARDGETFLQRGQVYTVRWIGVWGVNHPPYFIPETRCIRLEGINRGEGCWGEAPAHVREHCYDMPYAARRFRPVVERKTDTGFEVLDEIRRRESVPDNERVRRAVPQEQQSVGGRS